jgi:glyoxylase-like metal-dependent hydrolase (beta-lactamase superfamily II)
LINKIQDNFYCITLPMPFRLKHVHVYALVNGNDVALFDTGFKVGGSYEKLESDLTSIGLGIKSVRDIYLTHVHADHCGMAGLIKEKSGAKIHLSAVADESNQNYSNIDLLTSRMKKFYLLHGMSGEEIEALIVMFSGLRNIISTFQGDDHLQPNKIYEFGAWNFEIIFTPGHSNGHVCYYFPKEKFLLSGDTVLPQITPNLSPDLVDENFRPLHSFLHSLQLLETLPVEKIYPGHGNVFSDLKTRTKEMREHHTERTQLILNCISATPKTTFQVSQEIFGSDLLDFDKFLALNETYVHLLELKLKGAIKEDINGHKLVYTRDLVLSF